MKGKGLELELQGDNSIDRKHRRNPLQPNMECLRNLSRNPITVSGTGLRNDNEYVDEKVDKLVEYSTEHVVE